MSPGPAPDQDPAETISRRKLAAAAAAHWSDEDKKIFLALLAQHGDDFKRIAASMPNKTTVQVSNYYKSNLSELELEKVAASAPKRSPTPEAPIDAPIEWKELPQYPGSGVMSPIVQSGPSVSAAPTAGHSQVAQSSTYSTNLM
ncbi:hypothetical protein PLICRDRAFT_359213 [Plicaturopsis crispa FD-325 SS-3]|uniref:Unplaced genomic scaffold PLICRscaffold_18, whole genome shotgun sequence n=1 Tax=Plicaturopsis crispa FD-325 SS-3 TaxID=944288 RepID=A0A0C9T806_PLICR|nr:hypothetical protein PLICRDRAFT_359213 [Plicaturopsis crispa FD-325 SS-3]